LIITQSLTEYAPWSTRSRPMRHPIPRNPPRFLPSFPRRKERERERERETDWRFSASSEFDLDSDLDSSSNTDRLQNYSILFSLLPAPSELTKILVPPHSPTRILPKTHWLHPTPKNKKLK
jgi:hypothetical protein